MLNDLLTLARIREGDIKAFEDVFRRYYCKHSASCVFLSKL